jgi:serine/threonine protein kinase
MVPALITNNWYDIVIHHFVDIIPSTLVDYCWDTVAPGSPAAFVIMDLRAMSLHALLRQRHKNVNLSIQRQSLLSSNEVISLLIPLSSALLTLSTENIVYPDLKPSNILLNYKNRLESEILANEGATLVTPVITGFGRAMDLHSMHLNGIYPIYYPL